MNLHELTVHEAAALLRSRQVSSVELTQALLQRIDQLDGRVKAYVTVTPEQALDQARGADGRLAASEQPVSPLLGVPIGLKDVLVTQGVRTTCSSRILEKYVPPFDGTAVARLRAAGAVFLGKTNCDEFAMGSSTENSAFFSTANPWALDRVPGGSSGGSAAAMGASECLASLGTDTGGSIRQPAALCGVVGFKPTYGRVSRFGLVAFASSLDQIGPFTRDVEDCAIVLESVAGHDPRDSTSVNRPVPDYRQALNGSIKGLRIGVPREYFGEGIEPGVEQRVREAIGVLQQLGAEVGECSLPSTGYALDTYYIIAPAEASANLARYDGIRYGFSEPAPDIWSQYNATREGGFGAEVKRRIMLGTYVLSAGYYDAYYLKAQKVRTLIKQEFDQAFERFDLLAAPTSPTVAFKLGEKTADPLAMYLNDVLTIPVNMAGLPGMSVPCGLSDGLPVGLQLIGRAFDEETLLRTGHAFQQATDHHSAVPSLG